MAFLRNNNQIVVEVMDDCVDYLLSLGWVRLDQEEEVTVSRGRGRPPKMPHQDEH